MTHQMRRSLSTSDTSPDLFKVTRTSSRNQLDTNLFDEDTQEEIQTTIEPTTEFIETTTMDTARGCKIYDAF